MRKGNTFSLKLNERHEGTKMIEMLPKIGLIVSTVSLALLYKDEAVLALAKTFGYKVTGVGFKKVHYTLSKAEALQWMGCYNEALLFKGSALVGGKKTI
jgi:hypothetical protein